MEVLLAILIVIGLLVGLKIFVWFLKAGIFMIVLPIKIILGAVLGSVFLLLLPLLFLPALVGLLLPLIPILLLALGVVFVVKYVV
ncbi:MAG: hypothetical protein P8184_00485 [Calditrichia bacterium]